MEPTESARSETSVAGLRQIREGQQQRIEIVKKFGMGWAEEPWEQPRRRRRQEREGDDVSEDNPLDQSTNEEAGV